MKLNIHDLRKLIESFLKEEDDLDEFKKYKGKFTFDGGFCSFFNICPYYSKIQPSIIIDPDLFSGNTKDSSILGSSFYPYDIRTHSIKRIGGSQSDCIDICDIFRGSFESLDIRNINLIKKMYEEGYKNCIENKKFLDEIFNWLYHIVDVLNLF